MPTVKEFREMALALFNDVKKILHIIYSSYSITIGTSFYALVNWVRGVKDFNQITIVVSQGF